MSRLTPVVLFVVTLIGCSSHPEGSHQAGHPKPGSDEHMGHAGDHGNAMLMVQTDPVPVVAGKPTTLKLMIHDAGGAVVKDFDVVHEEKVHLIIVRDGLDQFAHVHPLVDAAG